MFQSAPAIAGGRCADKPCICCGQPLGFNPRPPLLAGDAQSLGGPIAAAIVSIRARHCWRAMLPDSPILYSVPDGFNPRPPLLAGDARRACASALRYAVSIRARHCWRAMHTPGQAVEPADVFQSAPAIAGGRCTPARLRLWRIWIVSIRARHCWRAMRSSLENSRRLSEFQSAPAIAGGRCHRNLRQRRHRRRVSIRARHCWRAMRRTAGRRGAGRGFNPRPPLLAGDASNQGSVDSNNRFQSAPAIAGGRCRKFWFRLHAAILFQSAPAIAGGRCRYKGKELQYRGRVSIRARHCWRAMRGYSLHRQGGRRVSIRARHCWRAMPSWPVHRSCHCRFNPRPPLLAGDARASRVG